MLMLVVSTLHKVSGSCTLETVTAHAIIYQLNLLLTGKYFKPAALKTCTPAQHFKIKDITSCFNR